MISEPNTLYKLMILYMLKQVKFPLSNAQLSLFFLDKEYTTYFTFQQVIAELLESNFIKAETVRNSSRYEITEQGEETLSYFVKNISNAIIEDMDAFLSENKILMRNEISTIADYYKSTNQDFIAHFEVREGKTTLIRLDLSVPTKEQAEHMCDRWKQCNQKIYSHIMDQLMED